MSREKLVLLKERKEVKRETSFLYPIKRFDNQRSELIFFRIAILKPNPILDHRRPNLQIWDSKQMVFVLFFTKTVLVSQNKTKKPLILSITVLVCNVLV